jgi:EmrB/QacA subfamily drug resistance transporter
MTAKDRTPHAVVRGDRAESDAPQPRTEAVPAAPDAVPDLVPDLVPDGVPDLVPDGVPADGGEAPAPHRIAATIGAGIAVLLVSLDGTIVGTAMPRILADLRGLSYYAWVTTAYLVTSTILMPIAGKLGDLFGRKPLIVFGVLGFMTSSWLVGASSSVLELVLLRAVQGVFGGVLTAVTFAVVADLYPVRQRVVLHGVFGGLIGLAAAGGPTLGGYITDHWGWRWIFYVNVPVAVPALVLTIAFLPYVPTRYNWRRIDFTGCAALTAALLPLLIALSIGDTHAWTSPLMLTLLGCSALAFPVFAYVEHRSADPIVPLELFRNRVFTIAMVLAGFAAVGLYGLAVYVPLLYQGVLGVSATSSGTLLTPLLIGMLVAAPISGQLITRVRYYRFIGTAGLAAMIVGAVLLTTVSAGTPQSHVIADLVVLGAGMGLVWPLSTAVVQAAMPRKVVGVATAQVNFWRSLGGTVAVVLLGSILTSQVTGAIRSRLAGLHLPPGLPPGTITGGQQQDLQTLLDPDRLEQLRAQLPSGQRPQFDTMVDAIRLGLAESLHHVFLVAALVLVVPLVASLFLTETPIPRRTKGASRHG